MSLSEAEAEALFGRMLDGAMADADIAATLIEMTERGETAAEIAGAARAMRARMIAISAPDGAIDVCGTGGDGQHSLNVSTAVALVAAAAGVPVAKHGNRAASSKAGGADTLEALGLNLDGAAKTAEKSLELLGICFLFAGAHHPAMARIMPIRRAIGRRTIFNLMGPLANPAGVRRQLVGIARPAYVPIYAEAIRSLGTETTWVVCGDEGLDELSTAGGNELARVEGRSLTLWRAHPADAALPVTPLSAIAGGDAAFNAAALRRLLDGERGAYRDAVLFNTAAALSVAGKAAGWAEGVARATEAIDSTRARTLLARWIEAAA
jgi:anthranilate phosphoribosyltransferase